MADARFLLVMSLRCAVPLWVEKLRGLSAKQLQGIAQESATEVGSSGDMLMFPARKTLGGTAKAFNHLARGIACVEILSPKEAPHLWQALQNGAPSNACRSWFGAL